MKCLYPRLGKDRTVLILVVEDSRLLHEASAAQGSRPGLRDCKVAQ